MNTLALRITDHRTGFDQTIELSQQALALAPAREFALWVDDERPNSIPVAAAERFTNNGDGTITDAITGLMWSAEDVTTERVDWAAADHACFELELGGHADWRLPTRAELLSLVDDALHDPAIDVVAFPTCKSSTYWAGTECVWDSQSAWLVGFHVGNTRTNLRVGADAFVRAVRSLPRGQSLCLNQSDPYAALRAASNAGARIQAWHLRGNTDSSAYGEWATLTGNAQFTCPAHLYRVHPEDLAGPDSETLVEGEGFEAIEAIQSIAELLGVRCTQEAIEEAIEDLQAVAHG